MMMMMSFEHFERYMYRVL